MPVKDMCGEQGYLKIISSAGSNKHKQAMWNCECKCGRKLIMAGYTLRNGAQSCGCYSKEKSKEMHTKHGMSKTSTYYIWQKMMDRCSNVNTIQYKNYGGRGIKVCDRWLEKFENFYEDMGERPEKLSLDRIDVNGDYCPKNCRWATRKEQNNNKLNTIYVEYNNEKRSLCDLSIEYKIPRTRLYARLFLMHWDIEKSLNEPIIKTRGKNNPKKESLKNKARHIVNSAIKENRITKPSKCETKNCQNIKLEAHHYMGYEEQNWLNIKWLCKQCHEKERSKLINFNGEMKTIKEIAGIIGIPKATLRARLISCNYISNDKTFEPLNKKGRFLTYNGKTENLTYWAKEVGISIHSLIKRLNKNLSMDEIMKPPQRTAYYKDS